MIGDFVTLVQKMHVCQVVQGRLGSSDLPNFVPQGDPLINVVNDEVLGLGCY